MSLDESILERVAQDGEMDYSQWVNLVEPMIDRINQIAYTEYETPRPYSTIYQSHHHLSPEPLTAPSSTISQNDTPSQNGIGPTIPATPTPLRHLPPVPLFPLSDSDTTPTTSQIADSLPPPTQLDASILPPPLLQLLDGIIKTLRNTFTTLPPHTVQRLAELVLTPTKHYRTLPAWLRALDRTISVTSTADIFPLPKAMPLPSHVIDSSLVTNGVHESLSDDKSNVLGDGGGGILWLNRDNGTDPNGLGSDEALGGALLTPIPWLRNGTTGNSGSEESSADLSSVDTDHDDLLGDPIDLPASSSTSSNGASGPDPLVPERENGAVTQGELIRQEQEAGVVPVGHSDADSRGMMLDDDLEEDLDEDTEAGTEAPHARGPELLGAVDVGKVGGKDVEVSLSHGDASPSSSGLTVGVRDAQEVLAGGRTLGSSHEPDGLQGGNAVDHMQLDEQAGQQLLQEQEESAMAESQTTQAMTVASHTVPDEDIEITDADGRAESQRKVGEGADNENVGADAGDTSTQ